MITLYTWKTPNGRKPAILLEELGIPYKIKAINISKDEQFEESFLRISPNNKIPALVDEDTGTEIFESGTLLTYIADKHGKFLPAKGKERYEVLQWVYWQVGGLGPMMGQLGHFSMMADEKSPYAIERFTKECDRLLEVMDKRLGESSYLGGSEYSIADIMSYPWVMGARELLPEPMNKIFEGKKNLDSWLKRVGEREAVKRGMNILQ